MAMERGGKSKKELNKELISAVHEKNTGDIKRLLVAGANPNAKSPNGNTMLHLVVLALPANDTSVELVKLLLSKGADPAITNNEGCTALDIANRNSSDLYSMVTGDSSKSMAQRIAREIPYRSATAILAIEEGGGNQLFIPRDVLNLFGQAIIKHSYLISQPHTK